MENIAAIEAINRERFTKAQTYTAMPHCAATMGYKFIEYIEGESLTVSFPVEEKFLNPAQSMQGGFISAAFDNVFGHLCYLIIGNGKSAAIDLNTNYHRPIFMGDELTITATVESKTSTFVHMTGKAFNRQGKLISTSTCTYMQIKDKVTA